MEKENIRTGPAKTWNSIWPPPCGPSLPSRKQIHLGPGAGGPVAQKTGNPLGQGGGCSRFRGFLFLQQFPSTISPGAMAKNRPKLTPSSPFLGGGQVPIYLRNDKKKEKKVPTGVRVESMAAITKRRVHPTIPGERLGPSSNPPARGLKYQSYFTETPHFPTAFPRRVPGGNGQLALMGGKFFAPSH